MKKLFIHLFAVLLCLHTAAQTSQPFYQEIEAFLKQDSINPPPQQAILFVGSSSFRMWRNVQENFPEHTIINRGFGGSSLPDLIRYYGHIIKPYRAKQVVIYAGENDFTTAGTSPSDVFQRFTTLYRMIREDNPDAHVVFVSIKPSPSREKLIPLFAEANRMIRDFLKHEKHAGYVNVFDPMTVNGKPDPTLFLEDRLHMNAKGYAIWQKKIKPLLKK